MTFAWILKRPFNFLMEFNVFRLSNNLNKIKDYGTSQCHNTTNYLNYFDEINLEIEFLDVENDEKAAKDLNALNTSCK